MYGSYRYEVGGWLGNKPSWSKWHLINVDSKEDAIYAVLSDGVRSPKKYEVGLFGDFENKPKTPKAKIPGSIFITANELEKYRDLYYATEDDSGDYKKRIESFVHELAKKFGRIPNGIFSQSSESAAMELARDFHGRDNKGVKEYTLASYYPKDLAELGILIELQVFADDDNGEYIPINFAPEHPDLTDDETNVVLAAKDKQLYFIGGDQEYDIEEFAEAAGFDWPTEALEKDEVVLGQVKAIAYFADKHHLEGPKEQKTGIPYQHEFAINEETGEQIGEYPTLVYCQKDKVFKLVGGSYEILPEGISG